MFWQIALLSLLPKILMLKGCECYICRYSNQPREILGILLDYPSEGGNKCIEMWYFSLLKCLKTPKQTSCL